MWTNDIIAKNAAIYVRVSTECQAARGTMETHSAVATIKIGITNSYHNTEKYLS
ncbi:hypothetical protein [Pectinatus frisingensis]|uniref:hypothetical protein n=1 Tax=Pectinatus frisingensis TaxID=865 RepID=UPI0018C7E6A2|nr:hypothetical protein [Pectinatus frisingensis]